MHSFAQLLTLSALVAAGFAARVTKDSVVCSGATLVSTTTIEAGGHSIIHTSHSCGVAPVTRRDTAIDVSGASCTTSCNKITGILPPISDDCSTIEDAIQILYGTHPATFVVSPNHRETLTFGTCSYFFQNTGRDTLQSSWTDLSTDGAAAGAACFPPVQPFSPEGLCSSYDGTWSVGATHS